MKDVNGFMSTLLGFKARIDAGKVPKDNFKKLKPLLLKEHFNAQTMRNKSNAAAGLCDYVRNITVYWDINEDTEPKRLKSAQAARDLEAAIKAKQQAHFNPNPNPIPIPIPNPNHNPTPNPAQAAAAGFARRFMAEPQGHLVPRLSRGAAAPRPRPTRGSPPRSAPRECMAAPRRAAR